MPWAMLRAPSIQLSTVKALLARKDIRAHVFNFNLEWMEHLKNGGLAVPDYYRVSEVSRGLGEWIFAVPPFRDSKADEVASFREFFAEDAADIFEKALEMRRLVPSFIAQCVDRIIATGPRVVGFTSTFQQNVPSLHLAKELKRNAEHITTVFGGANCDGPMGAALHRSFPFLDVVVRGEAEAVVGTLFEELLRGGPVTAHPAVCARNTRGLALLKKAEPAELPVMEDVPLPDHDDYFRDLDRLPFRGELLPTWIAFESARGCWWGQKHHCTFCGVNGTSMKFRSKSATRTLDELTTFSRKYRVTNFNATDNIIDMSYFDSLLPSLAASGQDYRLFYETKANLKKSHLEAMAAAGVREIQPGIESLSTPVLSLMRKGTTALQNIRLLKWALENRIEVGWNIIIGFPGEDPAEYAKMADLVPSLHHLEAPNIAFLQIHRFSPYHTNPADHSIRITGPKLFYKYVYPLDEPTLMDIAYAFDFEYTTPQAPQVYAYEAVRRCARQVWRSPAGNARSPNSAVAPASSRSPIISGEACLFHHLWGARSADLFAARCIRDRQVRSR